MQGKRTLVVGYGKLGRRIALTLAKHHEVTALKRSPISSNSLVRLCFADVTQPNLLKEALYAYGAFDYLIYCLSPSERSEQGYRDTYLNGLKNVMASMPAPEALKHIIFVSSTSVYHQANDEHVDEQSLCAPVNFSGRVIREAESFLAALAIPSTCVRFSGIYGGGRSRLIDQVKHAMLTGETLYASPGYTNRIHEDDCVGFICHLMDLLDQQKTLAACYVATDSCPVQQVKVYQFIAEHLALSLNNDCQLSSFKIEETDSAKSTRRAGSKQCLNRLMKQTNYVLKFESYKEGYLAELKGKQ